MRLCGFLGYGLSPMQSQPFQQKYRGGKAKRLVGDTAYGTGKFLGWLIETGITPHIPVWDKSTREDGTFSRTGFTFNNERKVYVCAAGKLLTTTGSVGADHVLRYLALTHSF